MRPARGGFVLALSAALALSLIDAQSQTVVETPPLNTSGFVEQNGHKSAYLIRHLPISSFPDLPAPVQAELARRGCLIPQTYEAHHPENVIHGSFEKPGSQDWAVLCSAEGKVSLLVFFASAPDHPTMLASAAENTRLQRHDSTGVLGFNWGIDTATPAQIHDSLIGAEPRSAKPDHDAVADSIVDGRTVYRYYAEGAWKLLDTSE